MCRPIYSKISVVRSTVRSDHKAVVAYAEKCDTKCAKSRSIKTFRCVSPASNALFLQLLASIDFDYSKCPLEDTQAEFNRFYEDVLDLLDNFYPERSITLTSRDPDYISAGIKAKLRRKNRLMRAGRIEQANAIAERIGKDISKQNSTRLRKLDGKVDPKGMWVAVKQITGYKRQPVVVDGVDAHSLNQHYATISTDQQYRQPQYKQSVSPYDNQYISEYEMFSILDRLRPTTCGLDQLPAWFLRLGAPVFCKPLARLFNLSLATSVVPQQWKAAFICPVPKVQVPKDHTDFRPISMTPVLK